MMPLSSFMILSIVLFTVSGMLHGWYKEFLGMVSVFVAVFVLTLAEKYVPILNYWASEPSYAKMLLALRVGVFGIVVFFGYQTPRWSQAKRNIAGLQGSLLGALLGAVNGYLIMGMLWHFLDAAGYPWPMFIAPPSPRDALTQEMLHYLPSVFLGVPGIYIVAAVMFVFVIVVFV